MNGVVQYGPYTKMISDGRGFQSHVARTDIVIERGVLLAIFKKGTVIVKSALKMTNISSKE